MSSNTTSNLVCYVIYVPYSSDAGVYTFHVPEDADVSDLAKPIRDHPDLNHYLKDGPVSLFKYGGSNKRTAGARYNDVLKWFRESRGEKLEPVALLKGQISETRPKPGDAKVIDAIALPESFLDIYCTVYVPHGHRADVFPLRMKKDASVDDLTKSIRDHQNLKPHLEDRPLSLFKYGGPDKKRMPKVRYDDALKWLRGNREHEKLEPTELLKDHFPAGPAQEYNKIDVIAVADSFLEDIKGNSVALELMPLDDSAFSKYHDCVSFQILSGSSPGKPDWKSVIPKNDYRDGSPCPQFVAEIAGRPRRGANDERLQHLFRDMLRELIDDDDDKYAEIVQKLLSSVDDADPYTESLHEIYHYLHGLSSIKFNLMNPRYGVGNAFTVEQASVFVFGEFATYWEREVEYTGWSFGSNFPFPLIAMEDSPGREEPTPSKYLPRPDVMFLKHKLPRFMVEFDSGANQDDLSRLRVQMACSLRLGCALLQDAGTENKDLFLMGAFFSKQRSITRLFVYADRHDKICFNLKDRHIGHASEFMEFLHEFYNYAKFVKEDDRLNDKQDKIATLSQWVRKQYDKNLHNKTGTPQVRPGDANRAANNDSGSGQGAGGVVHTAMALALQESGYEVVKEEYEEGFEPFNKLPGHVVEARNPKQGRVIAKLVRGDSKELSFFQLLSTLKSPHNHVVPFLGTVPSSLGPLIILRYAIPLSILEFCGNELASKSVQLSRELIEAVAFLHKHKIAHLDIKPDNLLYSMMLKYLYISDFELAMLCKDVDEMIETPRGTPGWSAPEIDFNESRPLRAFSPIKADLWSCGQVLRFLISWAAEKDETILRLTSLLLGRDPSRRPLLNEMVDEKPDFWTSGRLLRAIQGYLGADQARGEPRVGDAKLKRARDASHAVDGGLASKLVKRDGDWIRGLTRRSRRGGAETAEVIEFKVS